MIFNHFESFAEGLITLEFVIMVEDLKELFPKLMISFQSHNEGKAWASPKDVKQLETNHRKYFCVVLLFALLSIALGA